MAKVKKDLKTLILENREFYQSIGRVWCKVLNANVHFTSEGWNHLLYKKNRKKRNTTEQRYKITLLKMAIPVMRHATHISDWRFSENSTSDIQYYALEGNHPKHKMHIRVIVKRAGDGQFNFHSVMPNGKKMQPIKKPRKTRGK